jgi:hypothetical protein
MDLGIMLIKTQGNQEVATCFCTPGCKGSTRDRVLSFFPTTRFEEVPSKHLAAKVNDFLKEWDTYPLSSFEVKQESRLLKHFFCSERMNLLGLRRIDFHRKDSEKKYSINVVGADTHKISRLFSEIYKADQIPTDELTELLVENDFRQYENHFELQKSELEMQDKSFKNRVAVTIKNCLPKSDTAKKFETSIPILTPYDQYMENSKDICLPSHINQTMLYQFAHTPTLEKFSLFQNIFGKCIQQTFEADSI